MMNAPDDRFEITNTETRTGDMRIDVTHKESMYKMSVIIPYMILVRSAGAEYIISHHIEKMKSMLIEETQA